MNQMKNKEYIISETTINNIILTLDRLEIANGFKNAEALLQARGLLKQVRPVDEDVKTNKE